jgi:uncharacterized protein with GYD domain
MPLASRMLAYSAPKLIINSFRPGEIARYVLQLGGLDFVRAKTLKAFPETAYREIIRSLS